MINVNLYYLAVVVLMTILPPRLNSPSEKTCVRDVFSMRPVHHQCVDSQDASAPPPLSSDPLSCPIFFLSITIQIFFFYMHLFVRE
jgi:hypothetical protein